MSDRNPVPRLVAVGDLLADTLIPVDADTCARMGVAPGRAAFRERVDLDAAAAALGGHQVTAGGSAANTCVSFVQCGGRAAFITALMADELTDVTRQDLLGHGVELPMPTQPTGMIGRCLGLLLPDGERAMLVWQGESWRFSAIRAGADAYFAGRPVCDGVLIEGYLLANDDGVDVSRLVLRHAAELGAQSVLMLSDSRLVARHRRRFGALLAEGVGVVIGNEAEFEALSRPGESAGLALVTRGSRGAVLHAPDGEHAVTAEQLAVRSTIGAGDAFAGGFLFGLLSGAPHEESLLLARKQATKVLQVGPSHLPLR